MKINFGKYAGSTAKEIAIVDSGYASWAANNLKNPAMRQAFAQALIDAKNATVEEIAAAHEDPRSEHYGKVLEMVKADKAQATALDTKIANVLNAWSAESGKSVSQLKSIVDRCANDFESAPASMFSSASAHQMFLKYMRQYIACF